MRFLEACAKNGKTFNQLVMKAPTAQPDLVTWLIFPSSGKVRLVGASSEEDANTSLRYLAQKWKVYLETFTLTNYTAVGRVPVLTSPAPELPFHDFSQLCVEHLRARYNPELINYVTIPFENGVTCNLFYTRKYVAMGLRDRKQLSRLVKFLHENLPIKVKLDDIKETFVREEVTRDQISYEDDGDTAALRRIDRRIEDVRGDTSKISFRKSIR